MGESRFLKRIGFFICYLIIFGLLSHLLLNTYIYSKANFKLKKNINSVIFGHSHPETAYNDSLIANFKNLAQSGESYFYTYQKAKKVLNQNPQIRNVFIEFSNIDVTLERDGKIWNDKYMNWRYPIYSALMNETDRFLLLTKNPKSFIQTFSKTFKKQILRIQNHHYRYASATSGYLYLTESKLDSLLTEKAHKVIPENDYYKASVHNLLYLEKLVTLCKNKKINIYFIRSPMYKDSYLLSNNDLYFKMKNERFSKIPFLDFVDFPLANTEYRDLHHLNYKGAREISNYFNEWLKENTLR